MSSWSCCTGQRWVSAPAAYAADRRPCLPVVTSPLNRAAYLSVDPHKLLPSPARWVGTGPLEHPARWLVTCPRSCHCQCATPPPVPMAESPPCAIEPTRTQRLAGEAPPPASTLGVHSVPWRCQLERVLPMPVRHRVECRPCPPSTWICLAAQAAASPPVMMKWSVRETVSFTTSLSPFSSELIGGCVWCMSSVAAKPIISRACKQDTPVLMTLPLALLAGSVRTEASHLAHSLASLSPRCVCVCVCVRIPEIQCGCELCMHSRLCGVTMRAAEVQALDAGLFPARCDGSSHGDVVAHTLLHHAHALPLVVCVYAAVYTL